jgi:hypothetical protein
MKRLTHGQATVGGEAQPRHEAKQRRAPGDRRMGAAPSAARSTRWYARHDAGMPCDERAGTPSGSALHRAGRAAAAARGFHAVPAVHADRLGHDLEHLFRPAGAGLRLFPGHRGGAGQGLGQPAGCANPRNGSSSSFAARPLFIQFFFAYFAFSVAQGRLRVRPADLGLAGRADRAVPQHRRLFRRDLLRRAAVDPEGDIEAADAYGMSGWTRFRGSPGPPCCASAWPAYTNEAIFLFHATTLVFFSGFPARQQRGDALYYANYFADKTFNPFVPYPILAFYFILLTLVIIACLRADQPQAEPAPAAGGARGPAAAAQPAALRCGRGALVNRSVPCQRI